MIQRTIASIQAVAGATMLLLAAAPALAQDGEDLRVRVGIGAQTRPEYIGADTNEWAPLVDVSTKRGDTQFDFEAADDNFDIKLYSKNGFSIGPVANLQNSRKEKDVGAPVGKVPTTIEAGLFMQYEVTEAVRLRGEFRKGIGGHKGGVASLGADHVWRNGDLYTFSVGPRLLLSDARYHRAWFGVAPVDSLASGLPEFRPGAGVHALAATSSMTYQLGGPFGVFGYARAERLVGDAAKSPIVREYGSKTQLAAGLGLTYTFRLKI